MLTKTDLQQIGNVFDKKLDEKLGRKFDEKLEPITKEIGSIKRDVNALKKDVSETRKDVKVLISYLAVNI